MEADLARIKVALAIMSNVELDALIKATYKVEQIAPGLLAWLDSACLWQLQRRSGYDFELQPPESAIPPEEDAVRCPERRGDQTLRRAPRKISRVA